MLKTNNPHAWALICDHLGGVKMVEIKADLERANRAIMQNRLIDQPWKIMSIACRQWGNGF